MTLDLDHGSLAPHVLRLDPYVGTLLAAAGRRALRLHADQVTVEHLLGVCMEDGECAAYQVVEHAFADPETLDQELLALSPGIMVVGSAAVLPFSPRAVEALRAARDAALGAGAAAVRVGVVAGCAARVLPEPTRDDLRAAGLDEGRLAPAAAEGPGTPEQAADPEPAADPEQAGRSLFERFDEPAKRALALANKGAHGRGEHSIGPAQLVIACLRAAPELEALAGLSAARARELLAGRTADDSEPAPRLIPPHPELSGFLERVPGGGGSLDLLAAGHALGREEIVGLLLRHRITEPLLERARDAFRDPTPGS